MTLLLVTQVNLYLGTIFGEPEDILCEGQFVVGTIFLDQKPYI